MASDFFPLSGPVVMVASMVLGFFVGSTVKVACPCSLPSEMNVTVPSLLTALGITFLMASSGAFSPSFSLDTRTQVPSNFFSSSLASSFFSSAARASTAPAASSTPHSRIMVRPPKEGERRVPRRQITPPRGRGQGVLLRNGGRLAPLPQQARRRRAAVVAAAVDAEVAEPVALRQAVQPVLLRNFGAGVVLRRARFHRAE